MTDASRNTPAHAEQTANTSNNKIRNTKPKDSGADFRQLKDIPEEYFENISRNSPESVLKLIGKIIAVLLLRLNVPKDEVAQFTDQIERRNFTMLFENFEAYDVQEQEGSAKQKEKQRAKRKDRQNISLTCWMIWEQSRKI